MMTCRELTDFLSAYLAGELSTAQRAEFERHLAVCPPCVRYLRTFEQAIALGKAAYRVGDGSGARIGSGAGPCVGPDADAPPDVPEDLIKAIMAARRK